ncbi:MAG: transglycosylase domain-containing protein [Lachnospiraceae bacterium]|jgi:penicillin-binding protein 1A|nr:transglycosylase domain-containing protein [Lachnospiraceae bacterium]
MNYGRIGVREKQRALKSKSTKWGRKIMLTGVRLGVLGVICAGIMLVAGGIGLFRGIIATVPAIDPRQLVPTGQSTIIYDSEGNEIDKYVGSDSNRTNVTMEDIPLNLANAFVAIEDKRFYQHNGIDVLGLVRAAYQVVKTGGDELQGASTITQQLLKNMVFVNWMDEDGNLIKMIKRKLKEQFLAVEISKVASKEEVLLQYMNVINLGQNTLGVEAASERYFGKSCSELTLSECAVIASITQNPTRYNPISHPDRNAERRSKCLQYMLEDGYINQQEYDEAIADTAAVYERIGNYNEDLLASNSGEGSYFSDALQNQVLDDMIAAGYSESIATSMLLSGGLRIYSTLDPTIQSILDEEVANPEHYPELSKWELWYALTIYTEEGAINNYSKENMTTYFTENVDKEFDLIFDSQDEAYAAIETYRNTLLLPNDTYDEDITLVVQPQVSVSIMDQTTGYVLALVGGRGQKGGRLTLNRAVDSTRQPGSTFKVLAAYAPALDSAGLTLADLNNDAPFNYAGGEPVNNWYDNPPFRGIHSLRTGIIDSMNVSTVKLLTQITPRLGFEYLLNFGFTTLVREQVVGNKIYTDIQQPLALGGITNGVTNLELCAAYATIANQGSYVKPKLYTKVVDSEGNAILDNTNPTSKQVLKKETAFLLTDALADAATIGTGAAVNFGNMSIAGKTGTTSATRDVWFAGFTPYYTCVTWAGYDNNNKLNDAKASAVNESNISKRLWKAVMQRVHEELPNINFEIPEGIVQRTICKHSGLMPIPGLCDVDPNNLVTEYFALGTEPQPEEMCNIHYQGPVCQYDNLAASEMCPFVVDGIMIMPLVEDPSLYSGYPEDTVYATTHYCQHTAEFYLDPAAPLIVEQQRFELQQRIAAAQVPQPNPIP